MRQERLFVSISLQLSPKLCCIPCADGSSTVVDPDVALTFLWDYVIPKPNEKNRKQGKGASPEEEAMCAADEVEEDEEAVDDEYETQLDDIVEELPQEQSDILGTIPMSNAGIQVGVKSKSELFLRVSQAHLLLTVIRPGFGVDR